MYSPFFLRFTNQNKLKLKSRKEVYKCVRKFRLADLSLKHLNHRKLIKTFVVNKIVSSNLKEHIYPVLLTLKINKQQEEE